jgi:hypothetical protein
VPNEKRPAESGRAPSTTAKLSSKNTSAPVDLDIAKRRNRPAPATVTGIDGKSYTRPEPKPPTPPRRRPITTALDEQVYKLSKLVASIERLSEDDRFDRNLDALRLRRSDLVRARDALDRVLAKFEAVAE